MTRVQTRRVGRSGVVVPLMGVLLGGALLLSPVAGQESPEADSTTGLVTEAEAVRDSLLASRLRAIFGAVEEFSGVTASVTLGVVELGGTVDQPDSRRRVGELVGTLDGVLYVVNEVEAATDVETRITPAVAKIQEYWDRLLGQLPVLVVALIVVLFFWALAHLVGRWRRPSSWTGINPLVWGFVSRLIRGGLAGVGLLLAFDILGITSLMGAVLGTAGIVGLAIGFAFQDIVENYLAGMLLSLRRPFSVNDLVRVGDFEGRVVRLTSREVVLLSFEGNHVRLPNAHVFKNPLTNFTANPRRLFSFDVGVGVEEDLLEVSSIGTRTLQAMKGVMEDPPPFARFIDLGDSSVKVRLQGWVDQRDADFLKVRSEAIRLVKTALDAAGVEMPEPIYRVYTGRMRERPAPPAGGEADVAEEAARIDVIPDGKLDAQVMEDLRTSDDENLLED
ncbi:MAG: mechanosensitive ion channel family protein [Longimicrobiales bacterium]